MKKYLFIIITLAAFTPFWVNAHAGHMSAENDMADEATSTEMQLEMGSVSIDDILAKIIKEQGVTSREMIDCQRVSENDLEVLGDAIMERMHPGEAHEFADQMMGGEGSDSLRAMHILLAKRYLGCASSDDYRGVAGMMMGDYDDMMGPGMFYGDDTQQIGFGWGGMTFGMIAFWAVIIAIFVWLVKSLIGGGKNKALAVLAERYARGEISQAEYEKMKKEIDMK